MNAGLHILPPNFFREMLWLPQHLAEVAEYFGNIERRIRDAISLSDK